MTRCPWHGADDAAGFTLLEALLATALMGAILAALATITAQWLPNWNRGFARAQRSEQIALGLERLVADLASAEFIPGGREARQPIFDGTPVSATFVRGALGPGAGPGLEIVRIAEVSSDHGPVLVRTRAPFAPVAEAPTDREQPPFADPVVLMRAPLRLSFSYAAADRIWRDSWQRQAQLPRAVKLTVRDTASARILAVSTSTVVHVEVPADCILTKSLADCIASLRRQPDSAEADKPRAIGAGQRR
jgi:general secretion pathway protein J